jgi:hypothetical protein
MKINLRNVKTKWLNLDSATSNAERISKQCDDLGILDHSRHPAVVLPCPEGTRPSEVHYVGVGQTHINCLEENKDAMPFLILEDDATLTEDYQNTIEVPDDTDAIYLGTSHGDGRYMAQDIGGGLLRIGKMFAAHAVLYITERYRQAVVDVAKECIYKLHVPFDIGTYNIMENFLVVAPHRPWYYQGPCGESLNNWEWITRPPLQIRSSSAGPIGA